MILALLVNWLTFWRDTNSHAASARGVKAFSNKKYADAVKSFDKANAIAPTPARAFNLGTAEIAANKGEAGAATLGAEGCDGSFRVQFQNAIARDITEEHVACGIDGWSFQKADHCCWDRGRSLGDQPVRRRRLR